MIQLFTYDLQPSSNIELLKYYKMNRCNVHGVAAPSCATMTKTWAWSYGDQGSIFNTNIYYMMYKHKYIHIVCMYQCTHIYIGGLQVSTCFLFIDFFLGHKFCK